MQGLSHQLKIMTGLSLNDFVVPSNVVLRPVRPGEVRVRNKDGHFVLLNVEDKTALLELPPNHADIRWPLLTTVLDSGSIGLAGTFFGMGCERLMMNTFYDEFHADVRDVKGAAAASLVCSTTFVKWERLGSLRSFTTKGPVPKMMRWLAWCENYCFHIDDYWPLVMLLDWSRQ